jgi:SAM-dependent methyltransferase
VDRSCQAVAELTLRWDSPSARHADRQYFDKFNFWRDVFPGDLGDRMAQARAGETVVTTFREGELVPRQDPSQILDVSGGHFRRRTASGAVLEPRRGRFYPRGLLSGLVGSFPQDRRPFRLLGERDDRLDVDLNHPLSRYPLTVEGRVLADPSVREERGGRCNDLPEDLTSSGPGLQAAYPGVPTDFFSGDPFAREDPRDDRVFYGEPRLVHHLDAVARDHVQALYGRALRPGMRVLDLMSSWTSHLPEGLRPLGVTGLGMNAVELEHNPRLSARVVHDLNQDPALPFDDARFDAAICTVSVEYLTRPREVFEQVARVLVPGAPFVLTFSDRWFPPKVVRVWAELHPFERMGLVLACLEATGAFERLETESIRGWPRPDDDRYAARLAHSDPVYAVWGHRCLSASRDG